MELRHADSANRPLASMRNLGVKIPEDAYRALVELARDEERTLAGEVRYILKTISENPELLVEAR